MQNPVRWFEIYVSDMARAKKFYGEVFQVEFNRISPPESLDIEMWGFPSDPEGWGCTGALVKMKGLKPSGLSTLVYFSSEDCAIEEARIEQAGGKIDKKKFAIGQYGFITLGFDTEGTMFGIHSMK